MKLHLVVILVSVLSTDAFSQDAAREDARDALHRSVSFFRNKVAVSGSYLGSYSANLIHRQGENTEDSRTAWIQPPGTPSVGQAYLVAWHLTREQYLLDAAHETALALVKGQLQSGGWDYVIKFDVNARRKYAYRVEPSNPKGRNVTTLDDDTTQAALRFLMRVDRALEFKDERIREAVEYAWSQLLRAQYPNGAWPQRFSEIPDSTDYPVIKANYPKTWSREYVKQDYRSYYTLNDNTLADMIETAFEASEIYPDDPRFKRSARKAGDFIILAQMPRPQPAWAQQYDAKMQPAWARRFEPPAVTGGESQGVLSILMLLYQQTGDGRYLQPIPAALDWLQRSALADNRISRFHELRTNMPLYFTKDYELTYDSGDLPTHYGFITSLNVDSIRRRYEAIKQSQPISKRLTQIPTYGNANNRRKYRSAASQLVRTMDVRGAWLEPGKLKDGYQGPIISSRTFAKNIVVLARYIGVADD